MTGVRVQKELAGLAKGLRCTEVKRGAPGSWRFDFVGGFFLNTHCPWRIINKGGIALGSEDDGQQFWLHEPVDGSKLATELLSATSVRQIVFVERTGDIAVEFESNLRLEVFNNSSGYEGWNCGTPSGLEVIGMGGGGTANATTTV